MKLPSISTILLQLQEFNDSDLNRYAEIVKSSFKDVNPVFTRKKYVDFFWHCATTVPHWIEQVVLANADAESQGSRKLLEFWKSTKVNKSIEDSILYHAKDEARHSHLFVKLTKLAFPFSYSHKELEDKQCTLTRIKKSELVKDELSVSDNILLDNLIQMNMGEIRTLIHMHFLGPIIFNSTPKENREKVYEIIQGLAKDEILHIAYTSKIIEDWCTDNNSALASKIYTSRLREFHKMTIAQTEDAIRMYGEHRYPELLEI